MLGFLVISAAGGDLPIRLQWGNLATAGAVAKAHMKTLRKGERPQSVQRTSQRGTVPWLVQFQGEIREEWKAEVVAAGAELQGYFPENAFLVEATPKVAGALAEIPAVVWVGEYRPDYKRARAVRAMVDADSRKMRECRIFLFRPQDVGRIRAEVDRLPGASVVRAGPVADRGMIRAHLDAAAIEAITGWAEVEWIEPHLERQLWDDVAVQASRMNVTGVWSELGLTGAGQTIAMCDTGLDSGNPGNLLLDFTNRVTGFAWTNGAWLPGGTWRDTHGHGTHVAGSILGNGTLSTGLYKGVAYDAHLVLQAAGTTLNGIPADLNELFLQAFTNGARIHSNSWGVDDHGAYSSDSRHLDMFVWSNKTMLVVVAAGNSGIDANADGIIDLGSVSSPATAKNCLTVGAAENHRTTGGYSEYPWGIGSWSVRYPAEPISSDLISSPESPQGMAAFSGRGPCLDGRIKPELVAPGTDVISTKSRMASSTGWGLLADNPSYHFRGGTSMATPLVAGAAGLARQWLAEERSRPDPSAALVKALLLNGARNMAPGQYGTGVAQEIPPARPNNVAGWGHVDLFNTLQPAASQFLDLYDSYSLATGESNVFALTVEVPTTNRFVLTMAYSDYWAALGAGKQLVNDLDLTVRKPGGTILYPNNLATNDDLNNVESIEFAPDEAGDYAIIVAARTVPEGGTQDYALVVRGYETGAPDVPPAFDPVGVPTATVGVAMGFAVTADGHPAPVLTLQSATPPGGYGFDPSTGHLAYTPAAGDVGMQMFVFTAVNSAGAATQSVDVTVGLPDGLEVSRDPVRVREGGEGRFFIRLAAPPLNTVAVSTERVSGDEGLWVKGGAVRTFTPANWSVWQVVTLGAVEDTNAVDETATFRLTAAGMADRFVTAVSLDGEVGQNIAPASGGTVLTSSGASTPEGLIDGIHGDLLNRGYASWTRVPPGWIALDLQAPSVIDRMRVLNWDWTYRLNRYRIEGSLDGATWSLLADAGGEPRHGWDDWTVEGGPYRYLRLTGLSNSVNFAVIFAEWEVYGVRGAVLSEQTIDFAPIESQWMTNVRLLSATASSGLPVVFSVVSGPAELNGNLLSFTGEGTVTVAADQPGDQSWLPAPTVVQTFEVLDFSSVLEVSRTNVLVRESGEGRFFVRLRKAPAQNVVIAVARESGDPNLWVSAGSALTITPGTWNVWRTVTLNAGADANGLDETALFRLMVQGAEGTAEAWVLAQALDEDAEDNLALASNGTTVTGSAATRPEMLIDGFHDENGNYAHTIWNPSPPGWITMDLKSPVEISRIRLLNWDWTYRVHRYRLEGSLDGVNWTTLALADEPRHGWDEWPIEADPVRYVRFTGLSNSVHSAVCIAELEILGQYAAGGTNDWIEVSRSAVHVREGGEGRFFVRLKESPATPVAVEVIRTAGDTNLWVKSGGIREFTAANWSQWLPVTLAANPDANDQDVAATFRVTALGAIEVFVEATALDDDIGENVALASSGTTVTGDSAAWLDLMIDGIHDQNGNYGNTLWTRTPPGWATLDLQEAIPLVRMRLLNWDWAYRVHRYQVEASLDGTNWTLVADAGQAPRHGWDDWEMDGTAYRYLRFTGLSNSANSAVCIAEWEVYAAPPPGGAGAAGMGPGGMSAFSGAPVTVLTSDGPEDETGWRAVDGDPETAWVGQKTGGGYLVVEYQPELRMSVLEVDMGAGSLTTIEFLYSLDAEEWQPLPDDMETHPVELNYLWLVFPDDGSDAVPQVIEVRPNP